jgi:hypothetical protein
MLAPALAQAPVEPDFTSLKELVALIPRETIKSFKQPSQIETARQAANVILNQQAVEKTASIDVEIGEWEPWSGGENPTDSIRLGVRETDVDVSGLDFKVRLWVFLPATQQAVLEKLRPGSKVTASGRLNRLSFTTAGGRLYLDGDLRSAELTR